MSGKKRTARRYAVCIKNRGNEASLERNKLYVVLPDNRAEAESYARQLVGEARQQYERILQEAQQQAEAAASEAVNAYRSSGVVQSAETEELESRIAYLRTFAEVTQVQLRAVLEGLANEVDKLSSLPERSRQAATNPLPRHS